MQSSHLVASFLAAGPELGAVSWQLPAAGRIRIPQRGICSAAPAAVSWFGTTGLEPLVLLSGMALGLAMICWPVVLLLRSPIAASTLVLPMNKTALVLAKRVGSKILVLRNQKVILDGDLAALYDVPVRQLNQQVKRNADRFPADFLFPVTAAEYENLRSQNVISSPKHGGRRYLPHAFTEHGAIMAATVLNSKRAIEMSLFVVRAFVRMREAMLDNQRIAAKLDELESRIDSHDGSIEELVEAIRELIAPLPANNRRIGFEVPGTDSKPEKALKARRS